IYALVAWGLATSSVSAASFFPYAYTREILPNGLTGIVIPMESPGQVAYYSVVRTGSRNEVEEGKSGFAHFFEHMMFRGTPAWPPEARERLLTRAGARGNASTTDDYTNYRLTFGKEDLEQILAVESDRFMNLAYAEADFRTEARAVLGEYNKS